MDWDANDIKKCFNGVVRDSKHLNSKELELKYAEFKAKFEKLYNIAIDSVITGTVQESLKKLDMMLEARRNMKSGRMNKLNTDMLVGNQLGREYIYPLTNTPSKEDYQRAISTIKQKEQEQEQEQ